MSEAAFAEFDVVAQCGTRTDDVDGPTEHDQPVTAEQLRAYRHLGAHGLFVATLEEDALDLATARWPVWCDGVERALRVEVYETPRGFHADVERDVWDRDGRMSTWTPVLSGALREGRKAALVALIAALHQLDHADSRDVRDGMPF